MSRDCNTAMEGKMNEYENNTQGNANVEDTQFSVPDVPYYEKLNSPEKLYKRAIRHENMIIFFLIVGFYVISAIVSGIAMTVSMFINGDFFETVMNEVANTGGAIDSAAISDTLAEDSFGNVGLISILGMAAGMLLFLVLRGRRLFTADITETREKMQAGLFIKLYVVAMGAQLIFGIVSAVGEYVLNRFGLSALTLYEESVGALITPLGLLYAMLLGPIMEEIIFRGAIMKQLERFGANYAIILSSLIFALYHLFVFQAVFAFFVGIILAYTAHKYSLKWSILLHILINSSALGFEAVLSVTLFNALMLAFLIVAIILFVANYSVIKTQVAAGKSPMPKTFKYAFSGGFVISMFVIFIIVNIGMILMPQV
jgi:membrane protease YdiL (CAAX protease family)